MNKMLPDMTPHRMLLDVNGSAKKQISNLVRFNQHIWPFQWRDYVFFLHHMVLKIYAVLTMSTSPLAQDQ